jgi:hypothetical protein
MAETVKVGTTGYVRAEKSPDAPTAWVGWVIYASVMMILLGVFQFIAGLVAAFDDKYYDVRSSGLVLHISYTGWGVIHMILGVLAVAGGYALMKGHLWARVYAVALAMLNAVSNLLFLSAYPIWGVIMITIDALVIWAVCVHGNEVRSADL